MSFMCEELNTFEVKKWIKDLFQDSDIDIPDFEKNPESLKLISKIILLNREAEKDVQETIKAESHLADYYNQKSDAIPFGNEFPLSNLNPGVIKNVNKIAFLATQMKLKEPTVTNFLLGSSSLDNKREFYNEQELVNGFTLSKISKKITDIIHKNTILERNIEELQKKVSKHQNFELAIHEQFKFFKVKGEEYAKKIKKAEKRLKNSGFNSSLSHCELVKRSESLQDMEQKVKELTSKLESYQNLPPNEMLTRIKIEEAQTELLRLQNEFENLLKFIC